MKKKPQCKGRLNSYADITKVSLEEGAWERNVVEGSTDPTEKKNAKNFDSLMEGYKGPKPEFIDTGLPYGKELW